LVWAIDGLLFLLGSVGVLIAVVARMRSGETLIGAWLTVSGVGAGVVLVIAIVGAIILWSRWLQSREERDLQRKFTEVMCLLNLLVVARRMVDVVE